MKKIYAQIELAKEQFKVGLISLKELNQILSRLNIELMGCDYL